MLFWVHERLTLLPRPLSAFWTIGKNGHCVNIRVLGINAGIFQTVADLLVTILPIPMVMNLQLPTRQRAGVVFLLSLGFIATAASAVRIYYIWKALFSTYDVTWDGYPAWISAAIEIDLGIIVACVPALRTFVLRYTAGKERVPLSGNSRSRDEEMVEPYEVAEIAAEKSAGDRSSAVAGPS
ncbi:MAG: hypothetical protein INR71_15490, partial [Terriglobus roseus]|nr:hypothetical protein [Terriglobus roseus]